MVRRALSACLAAVLLLVAPPSQAGEPTLNPILFQPAVFRGDLLTLSTARAEGQFGFTLAFGAHYTEAPLSFAASDALGRTFTERTIRNRVMGELLMGFTALEWFEIGVAMPLVLEGEGTPYRFTGSGDTSGFHVGELRTSIKSRIYVGDYYGLAVVGEMTAPTAETDVVVGNGLGGGGRLINDFYIGPVTLTINYGVYARAAEAELSDLVVGNEMLMGLGGEVDIYGGLAMLGEAYMRTPLEDPGADQATSMEAIAALRWSHPIGLAVTVGGGGGTPMFSGYGTSKFRFFGDVRYSLATSADSDMDDVPDSDDECPTLPEDHDGFQDGDGCPDPDNDEDGYLDVRDACPHEAEDFDEFEDQDGCPDWDNDEDSLQDDVDRCRDQAEDLDGFQDDDGCPDLDNDGDGIADAIDSCPLQRESKNGFEDEDGCPDYDGIQQSDEEIVLAGAVRFDPDTHAILPGSFDILRAAARYIIDRPGFKVVRIDVHTSKKGKREKVALDSKLVAAAAARAQSILRFMVTEGVQPRRLRLRAVGGAEPIADTRDKTQQQNNERIKLFVIEQE